MFRCKRDTWQTGADGVEERIIEEIETIFELGPVTLPAYPTTTVAARSKQATQEQKKPITKDKYFYKKQLRTK